MVTVEHLIEKVHGNLGFIICLLKGVLIFGFYKSSLRHFENRKSDFSKIRMIFF